MYRHPYASASLLRCGTLFESHDAGAIDMNKEHWNGRQQLASYMKRWEELLGISRDTVERSAKALRPVDLQLQAVSDLLYQQKMRIAYPKEYGVPTPTQAPYLNSLGPELASEMQTLVDGFDQENVKGPTHMSKLFSYNKLSGEPESFRELERRAFKVLSNHWTRNGYFVQRENAGHGGTIAIHNLDKDIGSESASYLLGPEPRSPSLWDMIFGTEPEEVTIDGIRPSRNLSLQALEKIDENLKKYGVAVVRNVFSNDEIKEIRKALHLKTSLARDGAFKILEKDANVSALKYSRGRIHCILRGTSYDRMLAHLQRFWMPVVYYSLGDDVYISNIQLVLSDPMSYAEPWHRHNRNFGVNVLLALDNIGEDDGRIQFLPGTHDKQQCLRQTNAGKFAVNLQKGDLLIYDSRILHRNTSRSLMLGRSSNPVNEARLCQSYLVYTYDRHSTPPPGQGKMRFIWDRWCGVMIDLLHRS